MKVLIQGAGVAGPAVAFWLSRAGHEVTLIEEAPQLRTGGYIIDFWGTGLRPRGTHGFASAFAAATATGIRFRNATSKLLRIPFVAERLVGCDLSDDFALPAFRESPVSPDLGAA